MSNTRTSVSRFAARTDAITALKPLGEENRKKAVKALEFYSAAVSAYTIGVRAYTWWDERRRYTVSIKSTDPIYYAVFDWLMEQVPAEKARSVIAETIYGERRIDDDDIYDMAHGSEFDGAPGLANRINDSSTRVFTLNGHKVRAFVYHAEDDVDSDSFSKTIYVTPKPDQINFVTTSFEAHQAILAVMRTMVAKKLTTKRNPRFMIMASHGHWINKKDLPPRAMSSVVLKTGQIERITEDLDNFLKSENEYTRRGIPWHRGYLLEGPPGTGKTSLPRALAGHFGLDLYYAPLGDVTNDTKLMDLIGGVQARSILLLEDVDVFNAATSRESEKGEVSLSGFLNALDGIATPHGLIVFLTSNVKDTLDPALVRPGRIDLLEHIGLPDIDQATRLFEYFYAQSPKAPIDPKGASPSALVEIFKRHMHSPDDAEAELGKTTKAGKSSGQKRN